MEWDFLLVVYARIWSEFKLGARSQVLHCTAPMWKCFELILDNLSNFQIYHKDCRQPNFKTNLQDVWVFQIFIFSKAQQIFHILKNLILENSSCNYVAREGLRTHQVSHQIASGCAVQALAYSFTPTFVKIRTWADRGLDFDDGNFSKTMGW